LSSKLDELKRKSVHGGVATGVAQAFGIAIQLTSTVVLARMLTPGDYGVLAMVMAVISFAGIFRDFGLSVAAIQKKHLTHADRSNLFWLNVAGGLILTLMVGVAAPAVSAFYGDSRLTAVTISLAPTFLFSSLGAQHSAALLRDMKFAANSFATLMGSLASLVVSVVLAYYGYAYWSLVWGVIVGAGATTVLLWLLVSFVPSRPRFGKETKALFAFGAHVTSFDLVNYFHRNLDNILIGKIWGSESLGFYSRAYSLLMLPVYAIRNPLGSVAFSGLSKLQDDPKQFREYYIQLVAVVALLGMPLTGFLTVHSDVVVGVLLGPEWGAVAPIFAALGVAALVQPSVGLVGAISLSLGRSKRYFWIGFLNAAVVSIGFIIAIKWGEFAVALSYSITNVITILPVLALSFAGTSVKVGDYFKAVAPAVSITVVAALTSLWLRREIGHETSAVALLMILAIAYGSVAVCVAALSRRCRGLCLGILRSGGVLRRL